MDQTICAVGLVIIPLGMVYTANHILVWICASIEFWFFKRMMAERNQYTREELIEGFQLFEHKYPNWGRRASDLLLKNGWEIFDSQL